MIKPQWLELPMFRTNFHGPKDVRAIEVRLYPCLLFNLKLIFCLQRTGFNQPGVLHVAEPSLDCLTYVWIGSLSKYWAGVTEVCLVLLVFLFSSFSSNQSWCLRDTGRRESIAEEWMVSLKTVQLSSTSSELCSMRLNVCSYQWWILASCCLISAWR